METNDLSILYDTFNIICCSATLVIGTGISIWMIIRSKRTHSYQLRAYVPTIWTSLGILFTFIAIIIGLCDIDFKNENGINIGDLVEKICPAFTTSVIGIIGAIITSLINKFHLAQEDAELDRDRMNRLKRPVDYGEINSPELVLFEIIQTIKAYGDKISSVIEEGNLINQSNKQLLKTLNEKVESESRETRNTLTTCINEQKSSFEQIIDNQKQNFEQTISNLNNKIEEKLNLLNTILESKIDNMNTRFDSSINRVIDVVTDKLANESSERNKELKEFINEQTKLYQGINDDLQKVVADIRHLFEEDIKNSINEFAKNQFEQSDTIIQSFNSRIMSDAEKILDEIKTKLDELYNDHIELIKSITQSNKNDLESSLKQNRENIIEILTANKLAIENVSNEIKSDNENIKSELVASQKRWKDEAVEIEKSHSEEVVNIHKEALKSLQEVNTLMTNIQNELIKVISSIRNEQSDIRNFIIESNKGIQTDLTKQIHDAFHVDEAKKASSTLINSINSTTSNLNAQISSIVSKLSNINETLKENTDRYSGVVRDSEDVIRYIEGTLSLFENHINVLHILNTNVVDLKKMVNEVELSIQRMKNLQSKPNKNHSDQQ